jgi:hypothetical protein
MSARPQILLDKVTIVTKVVKSGSVIVEGVGVIFDAGEVDVAIANSKVMGIALASDSMSSGSVTGDGVKTVSVALLDGGVCKVKCSGTATEGEYARAGTDGFENQTIGGGTTVKYLAGQFMQTGVDGDFVGMKLGGFAAGCA